MPLGAAPGGTSVCYHMRMGTITTTLTDAQKALLDETHYAVATDLLPDGSAHSTVVWVDHDGENLTFNTARGRLKTSNVERYPRVTVIVFDPANPFQRTLVVRGRAELIDEGARRPHRPSGQEVHRPGPLPLAPGRRAPRHRPGDRGEDQRHGVNMWA